MVRQKPSASRKLIKHEPEECWHAVQKTLNFYKYPLPTTTREDQPFGKMLGTLGDITGVYDGLSIAKSAPWYQIGWLIKLMEIKAAEAREGC